MFLFRFNLLIRIAQRQVAPNVNWVAIFLLLIIKTIHWAPLSSVNKKPIGRSKKIYWEVFSSQKELPRIRMWRGKVKIHFWPKSGRILTILVFCDNQTFLQKLSPKNYFFKTIHWAPLSSANGTQRKLQVIFPLLIKKNIDWAPLSSTNREPIECFFFFSVAKMKLPRVRMSGW